MSGTAAVRMWRNRPARPARPGDPAGQALQRRGPRAGLAAPFPALPGGTLFPPAGAHQASRWPRHAHPTPSSGQAIDVAPAGAHVLVVDDDAAIRSVIVDTLRDEGYTVVEAADGVAALRAVRTAPPSLILLDMTMPVMDGWQFAAASRRLPGPHAPIVCVTAAHRVTERASQIGADAVLPKPFERDGLIALVARFVPTSGAL